MRRASLLLVLLVGGTVSMGVAEQRGTAPPTPHRRRHRSGTPGVRPGLEALPTNVCKHRDRH